MPSNFPTSLDSYAGHNPGDVILDTHVDNVEDAIEAIEATVGITGSAVTASHDYRIAALEALPVVFGTITAAIAAATAGDTVWVPAGIYREAVTVNKALQLVFTEGAEIRGSDDWSNDTWDTVANGYRSTLTIPALTVDSTAERFSDTTLGPHAEQVFLDGEPLQLIGLAGENPATGQFTIDANRRVILHDNPAGHLVEVTTRQYWIHVTADDVALIHPQCRHSAGDARPGSITNNPTGSSAVNRLTVSDAVLADSFGVGLQFNGGTGNRLYGGTFTRCGNVAIGLGDQADVEVWRPTITGSNYWGRWATSWEAAGIKAGQNTLQQDAVHFLIHEPVVSDCTGVGIWLDLGVNGGAGVDCIIRRPRVSGCTDAGIEIETCQNVLIDDPVVWDCGYGGTAGPQTAGILYSNSQDVLTQGGVVAWCADGIATLVFDRGDSVAAGFTYDNLQVDGTAVLMGRHRADEVTHVGFYYSSTLADAEVADATYNNYGTNMRFWWPWPESQWMPIPDDDYRFGYGDLVNTNPELDTLQKAVSTPMLDTTSRYLTTDEMLALCMRFGIPAETDPDVGLAMPFHFQVDAVQAVVDSAVPVTVANTASATALTPTLTLPAHGIAGGLHFRIRSRGVYSTTGTPTLTFRVKHGTTALATTGAITTPSGASNRGWLLDADVICLRDFQYGAGTWEIQGMLYLSTAAGDGIVVDLENTAAASVNGASASTLGLDVQWSAADASNTISTRITTIETLHYNPAPV